MKNQLRNIAREFLNGDKFIKDIAMRKAQLILQSIDVELSYSKIKNLLGITYLAGINSSSKIEKGKKENFDTMVLYLSASNNAGFDLCRYASEACRKLCLVSSGRAGMDKKAGYKSTGIYVSRLIKTWLARYNRAVFKKLLIHEVNKNQDKPNFAVRLNGTSDLNFSFLIRQFPSVQFYDYTKSIKRAVNNLFNNYHVTFSYSGENLDACLRAMCNGINVAVAVSEETKKILMEFYPLDVVDGDKTDLRFLDKIKGGLVLLSVKGNDYDKNSPFIMNYRTARKLIEEV